MITRILKIGKSAFRCDAPLLAELTPLLLKLEPVSEFTGAPTASSVMEIMTLDIVEPKPLTPES